MPIGGASAVEGLRSTGLPRLVILGKDINIYQNMFVLLGELGHNWSIAQRLACVYSNQLSLGDWGEPENWPWKGIANRNIVIH